VSCGFFGCRPGAGTLFKTTPAGTFAVLHLLTDCSPVGALVQGTDHNFYGTTEACSDATFSAPSTVFRLGGVPSRDDLVVDFGAAFGTWMLIDGDTSQWAQLRTASARNIVNGDLDGNGIDDVIVDFGAPYGASLTSASVTSPAFTRCAMTGLPRPAGASSSSSINKQVAFGPAARGEHVQARHRPRPRHRRAGDGAAQ
jgi:hypothetical protein